MCRASGSWNTSQWIMNNILDDFPESSIRENSSRKCKDLQPDNCGIETIENW